MENNQKDFLNRFGAFVEEVRKAFKALGKELAKDFRPLEKIFKEINEAIEKEEKRRKK